MTASGPDQELFGGRNVLQEDDNYWVAAANKTGEEAELALDLGLYNYVTGFRLKNAKKGSGTENFTIFSEGVKLVSGKLEDVKNDDGESFTVFFPLDHPKMIKFLEFQIDSFYGTGGGLQYFAVTSTGPMRWFLFDF